MDFYQKYIGHYIAYILFGLVAILFSLTPADLRAQHIIVIDLLTALTFRMSLRCPASMPIVMVFIIGLLRDFLAGWPLGVGALYQVFICDRVKKSFESGKLLGFWQEWLAAIPIIAGAALVSWLAALLTLTAHAELAVVSFQILASIICYPLVMLATRRLSYNRLHSKRSIEL